ncbi:hypothetical protein CRM22_008322 [Opisthorchis felineus]|uniref:Uncharacterized protein n=1 Tax=Opisthorchis felineus TaxID=147828 RepID=A0A4S2LIS4_OPIFE|nr:hypothetical protein CRM22_008322 [Opisthorchis felineus]
MENTNMRMDAGDHLARFSVDFHEPRPCIDAYMVGDLRNLDTTTFVYQTISENPQLNLHIVHFESSEYRSVIGSNSPWCFPRAPPSEAYRFKCTNMSKDNAVYLSKPK